MHHGQPSIETGQLLADWFQVVCSVLADRWCFVGWVCQATSFRWLVTFFTFLTVFISIFQLLYLFFCLSFMFASAISPNKGLFFVKNCSSSLSICFWVLYSHTLAYPTVRDASREEDLNHLMDMWRWISRTSDTRTTADGIKPHGGNSSRSLALLQIPWTLELVRILVQARETLWAWELSDHSATSCLPAELHKHGLLSCWPPSRLQNCNRLWTFVLPTSGSISWNSETWTFCLWLPELWGVSWTFLLMFWPGVQDSVFVFSGPFCQ